MLRLSSTGSWREMSFPSTRIVPLVCGMSRLIIFSVVVLPHPLGPTSTRNSPRRTRKLSDLTG